MFLPRSPADEGLDALPTQRLHAHWHRFRRGEPIGVVVPRSEVADIVDVAEHEGHGAEAAEAAARSPWQTERHAGDEMGEGDTRLLSTVTAELKGCSQSFWVVFLLFSVVSPTDVVPAQRTASWLPTREQRRNQGAA